MKWHILDCTLRDGGYYTNWDFRQNLVQNYLKTIADLPIEYIEIGYRNPTQKGYSGEYYYLPKSTLELLSDYECAKPKLALMLDAKNCVPQDVPNLLKGCQGLVRLVRLAVNPAQLDHGVSIARAVKDCGFEVALNLMYLSKLADNYSILMEFKKLSEVLDYLYLVDSYGACFPGHVKKVFQFAKDNLPQKIGFHGHDNINLAFANSLTALEAGADIVDSTVLGMGRGAGNLRTELIVAYLAQSLDKPIDLSSFADLLEIFQKMKDSYRWGSELPYVVSGLADLPQKDVMEWLGKKRYSTSTIVKALQGKQQKALSGKSYPKLRDRIEQLGLINLKTCVIVGGGLTAVEHSRAIAEYVEKQQGLVIHSSLRNIEPYAKVNIPQAICLPGREAEKLKRLPSDIINQQFIAYILSSAPRMADSVKEDLVGKTVEVEAISQLNINYQTAMIEKDSPLGLAFSVAQTLGINNIFLVGFDGYPGGKEVQQELATEVQNILDLFTASYPTIQVKSLTPTRYSIPQSSVYALLGSLEESIHHEVVL
ncbi:MAG: hypothetical protein F6K65_17815 [Moorea sp. SIO3C2]|nr:hypothetical protein [Moorena sp. SIO3C2]